jgi:hypothetical protein
MIFGINYKAAMCCFMKDSSLWFVATVRQWHIRRKRTGSKQVSQLTLVICLMRKRIPKNKKIILEERQHFLRKSTKEYNEKRILNGRNNLLVISRWSDSPQNRLLRCHSVTLSYSNMLWKKTSCLL